MVDAAYTPRLEDKGTFYPAPRFDGDELVPSMPESAEVVHVWGDSCVNLKTDTGGTPSSVLIPRGDQAPTGHYFIPDVIVEKTPIMVENLTGTLPPIPEVPAVGDPLFGELMAVHNAISALHRAAATVEQTGQMQANAAEVHASTAALVAATQLQQQAMTTTKAEVYLRALLCQFAADQPVADPNSSDPVHLNTIRNRIGVDWMDNFAMQAADAYERRFLVAQPPKPAD